MNSEEKLSHQKTSGGDCKCRKRLDGFQADSCRIQRPPSWCLANCCP